MSHLLCGIFAAYFFLIHNKCATAYQLAEGSRSAATHQYFCPPTMIAPSRLCFHLSHKISEAALTGVCCNFRERCLSGLMLQFGFFTWFMNSVFSVFYQALKYRLKVQSFSLSVCQKMFIVFTLCCCSTSIYPPSECFVLVSVPLRPLYEKAQSALIGQLLQVWAATTQRVPTRCVFLALNVDGDFILVTSQLYWSLDGLLKGTVSEFLSQWTQQLDTCP